MLQPLAAFLNEKHGSQVTAEDEPPLTFVGELEPAVHDVKEEEEEDMEEEEEEEDPAAEGAASCPTSDPLGVVGTPPTVNGRRSGADAQALAVPRK